MFTVRERERVRDRIMQLSKSDSRLVTGVLIGSTAVGGGDRWSDLDLTFGLADNAVLDEVLADWTRILAREFGGVHLFDLPHLSTIYRVFLLPSNLQVDLSFTPGNRILGAGLKHEVIFGDALERDKAQPPSPAHAFGLGVVYLLHARACIARGRRWEAEYSISAARDQALLLACLHRGLKTSYGRGFDDLPPEVLGPFNKALVESLDKRALLEALNNTIDGLLLNTQDIRELASKLEPQLRTLAST